MDWLDANRWVCAKRPVRSEHARCWLLSGHNLGLVGYRPKVRSSSRAINGARYNCGDRENLAGGPGGGRFKSLAAIPDRPGCGASVATYEGRKSIRPLIEMISRQ